MNNGLVLILFVLASCAENIRSAEIKVSGNCEMCKETIEEALKTPAIQYSSWNPETGILEVRFDAGKTNLKEIRGKVAAAGYDTDSVKANDQAYSKLHECCRYRESAE